MDADKQAEAKELPEKLVTLFALAWAVLRNRSIRFFRHGVPIQPLPVVVRPVDLVVA